MTESRDLYANMVGQERAVAQLRAAAANPVHAYLLVGPAGTGHLELARSFAASLVCEEGGCGRCHHCRRALAGVHPDVVVQERAGPFITVDEAREIGRMASLSPVEARRKVLVLVDFHLVREAAPALLKAMEEPPPTSVFVVLAEQVPPELVTIASRCVRIDLSPIPAERLARALVSEGLDAGLAEEVAAAAGGRPDRARLLASDPRFASRRDRWRNVPSRLDGTGAAVFAVAAELLAEVEAALEPQSQRHAAEAAGAAERARLHGERAAALRDLEARHRRERRRLRLDELRFGLAVLASAYRDRLAATTDTRACLDALDAIAEATEGLVHNPNETLLLQALLVRLSNLGEAPAILTPAPE